MLHHPTDKAASGPSAGPDAAARSGALRKVEDWLRLVLNL